MKAANTYHQRRSEQALAPRWHQTISLSDTQTRSPWSSKITAARFETTKNTRRLLGVDFALVYSRKHSVLPPIGFLDGVLHSQ